MRLPAPVKTVTHMRREQDGGVDVALQAHVIAQAPTRVAHVDRPVDADDIDAGGLDALQQAAAAIGVQRQRYGRVRRLDLLYDALQVGAGPAVPLAWGQLPAPGVEDLYSEGMGAQGSVVM